MSDKLFKTEIDLIVSEAILTPNLCAQLATQIFELLLFQRNQIPLVYTTFKFFVSKWDVKKINSLEGLLESNFEFQRQRYNAWKTSNDIKHFSKIIYYIFEMKKIIKSIRILIGSTPLMPKEIYIINIPNTCYDHYEKVHKQSGDFIIKKLLRTILASDKLSKTFVSTLKPTNVYMDFELESSEYLSHNLNLKDDFEYSSNSKQFHFNIINNFCQGASLSCCQNSIVFSDAKDNLENVIEINDKNVVSKNFHWYEINCVIKGFRGNKKYNIWK